MRRVGSLPRPSVSHKPKKRAPLQHCKGEPAIMTAPMGSEIFLYDGALARWWHGRSGDRAHARAYRNIADFIAGSYTHPPRVIVDYACGAGELLALLSLRFPHSRLVGLDGSAYLMGMALKRLARLPRRCSRRISLVRAALPDFRLMPHSADLAIFCFPNIVPSPSARGRLSRADRVLAESLGAGARERAVLEYNRLVSLNLRRLLRPGGVCVRVEYGTARREELSASELLWVSYEEGSLDAPAGQRAARPYFRVSASSYFRSGVLEDVFQQTGSREDRNGGYLITVLRAI